MENHICENTMSLVHHSSHILVFPSFQSFVVSGYFGVLTNKSCEISFPYKKIDFMTELICQPLLIIIIVLKGFQLPLFKAPTSRPSLPALLKIFFPSSPFYSTPHLRYFRQFPLPAHRQSPSCPNPTQQQPSLLTINGFKQISKGEFH